MSEPLVISNLRALEAEAIHIFREVAAEFERPVLLFCGGKDSIVLVRLAEKAFWPGPFPFPLMHVDTGHNFPEVIEFRDRASRELGARLIVASVQESIDDGRVVEETGPRASRNRLQTTALLDAIEEHGFDAAFGGARRDEERARAKERIFSFRDDFGGWDPEEPAARAVEPLQRADPSAARTCASSRCRTGPSSTSGSTSLEEDIEMPTIYFAHEREVFDRDGMLYATSRLHRARRRDGEPFVTSVRYRTVGDMSCTGARRSRRRRRSRTSSTEIAATRITERGETRADDRATEAAMEDRKREGYF